MILRLVIFLIINFGALAIGGLFTKTGVSSDWYAELEKAPWNPPGWLFGVAWTSIMICLAVYMALAWEHVSNTRLLILLFVIQWLLNVAWNPTFFYFQSIMFGLCVIVLLTSLVTYIMIKFWPEMKWQSALLLPYVVWLLVASSLNLYILFRN